MNSGFFKNIIIITALSAAFSASGQASPANPNTADVPAAVQAAQKKYGVPAANPQPVIQPAVTMGLKELVELEQRSCSWACVTSTFYDYRSVSIYRRRAGLHLGYDIAMAAGSKVLAGWPGTVVSIAPWSDLEWGVTIASSNGMEVTYGHILPAVSVGTVVQTGDVIGTIAINHVDVKMRDSKGNYVPFGENGKGGVRVDGTVITPEIPREQLMTEWLTARNCQNAIEDEIAARSREKKLDGILRQNLEKRYAEQHASVKKMEQFCEEGLVSRRETEQTRKNLENTRRALATVKKRQQEYPQKQEKLNRQLEQCSKRTQKAEKAAKERGITWQETQAFINNLVAGDEQLRQKVTDYKKSQNDDYINKVLELKHEIKACETALASQKKLFEMGGLPENELKATQKRLEELRESLKNLQQNYQK
ncbi:peptidoglycan DD-metalloendopeptidase family protein [bacterium]|nr:peptidoglycan DD-metalloendopeptidase family protein [bacterium]